MITALKKHFGKILAAGGFLAFALGIIGYREVHPGLNFDYCLYRTVKLFSWGHVSWEGEGLRMPLSLFVARWLAPLVTLGALFRMTLEVLERQWLRWRASRMRAHTILCGMGEKGQVLATSLREKRIKTILVDADEGRVEQLLLEGHVAVRGDATELQTLRRAGLHRAARLVALTGDDHDNLAIAVAASRETPRDRGFVIHLHCGDAALCDLYQRNRALTANFGRVPVRVFNHFRNLARRCIQDFPLNPGETGNAHVIVSSLSSLGIALIVEHALVGHFPGDRRTTVHLVSRTASLDLARLRSIYRSIDRCLVLEAVDLGEADRFAPRVADLVEKRPASDAFAIFPGFSDDNEAFARALELSELLRDHPSVMLLLDTPPGAAVRQLVEKNTELARKVSFLPCGAPTGGYEAIIGESLDRAARQIHDNWLATTYGQIEAARARGDEATARKHETKATFKPWAELNEEQKGANRSQADHIPFKIRAAGLDPRTVTAAEWAKLAPDTVESLARMEHERWAAYLWMTGWQFAPQRSDERKLHPNLVPYDDLDEPTKDYDRATIHHLSEYLEVFRG